jgi:hypothetical protein
VEITVHLLSKPNPQNTGLYRNKLYEDQNPQKQEKGGEKMKGINKCSMLNTILWACAILAAAVLLRGTQEGSLMIVILGGAAAVSICYPGCRAEKSST